MAVHSTMERDAELGIGGSTATKTKAVKTLNHAAAAKKEGELLKQAGTMSDGMPYDVQATSTRPAQSPQASWQQKKVGEILRQDGMMADGTPYNVEANRSQQHPQGTGQPAGTGYGTVQAPQQQGFGSTTLMPDGTRDFVFTGNGDGDPNLYLEYFQKASAETGVPVGILQAIAWHESRFTNPGPNQYTCQGVMQMSVDAALTFGIDPNQLMDPEQNILGAARYIAYGLKRYDGDLDSALGLYAGGYALGDNKKYLYNAEAMDLVNCVHQRCTEVTPGMGYSPAYDPVDYQPLTYQVPATSYQPTTQPVVAQPDYSAAPQGYAVAAWQQATDPISYQAPTFPTYDPNAYVQPAPTVAPAPVATAPAQQEPAAENTGHYNPSDFAFLPEVPAVDTSLGSPRELGW